MTSSLHARLGLGMMLSLVAAIGLLLLIAAFSVHNLLEGQLASRLEHDGESLLGGLSLLADGSASLDARRIQGIYMQPFSGHYFVIEVEGQVIRSRSLWDETLQLPPIEVGQSRVTHINGPEQQPLLLWEHGYRKQGRQISVAVAEDLYDVQAGFRRLWWQLFGGALLMVILVLLIQRFIVGRSLRPVADAVDDVARLEQGEATALREDVPQEVLPLVQAINHLLQRQRQRLLRSREAMGNMAHAIKTPLTLLQQIASEQDGGADSASREQLQRHIQRISELVDTSLRRARIAGDSLGTSRFDLRTELPVLVDTIRRLHRDRRIDYRQHLVHADMLPLEQQDGMELLGNLLDNAWKWADTRVQLSIDGSGGHLLLVVEDDGPGVSDTQLQQLARRGMRHDENIDGHGIGLSIVTSLVEAFGGSIEFDRSPQLGGLRVRIYCKCPEASSGISQ